MQPIREFQQGGGIGGFIPGGDTFQYQDAMAGGGVDPFYLGSRRSGPAIPMGVGDWMHHPMVTTLNCTSR